VTADVWLVLLMSGVFTVTGYLLWTLDARPRFRQLLIALAVVWVVATIVVYRVETKKIAAEDTAP
jgi:hypothetical protein